MFKHLSYVSLAYVFIYIGGYIFHFIVSRKLGPIEYGKFIVLNSLLLTVGNVAGILNTISVKKLVEYKSNPDILRYFRIIALLLGIFFFSIGSLFAKNIAHFININKSIYILFIAIGWFFVFFLAVERAYLQSQEKFSLYSFSIIFELFFKFVISIGLVYLGFKIHGILIGVVISLFLAFIFLIYQNDNIFGSIKALPLKRLIFLAMYASPVGFFVYIDDLFLRRIFDEHTAGILASTSILGKAFLGFCLILMSVFFPKFVEYKTSPKLLNFLIKYVSIVLILFILVEIFVVFWGKELFLILFGNKFILGFEILPYYLIAILILIFTIILMNIFIAIEKGIYLIYINLFVYFIGFLVLPISSVKEFITYIVLINSVFLFIYTGIIVKFMKTLKI
ncbi:hypothetical protein [Persephonella sp. KM09-Lau-8]|uniref:hypothetical protein n=1 Tax=Persephonella sp. KM09-Lau-8 TaxID=1158345 RepID=UPI00068F535C|nr:hypothetical protein [Persephonella sp. KM09-Lau-8]